MELTFLSTLLLALLALANAQQRVAPGVPPQNYQAQQMNHVPQHMPQQQMHMQQQVPQMQQHHQQVPQQMHQQVPQQMHQQVPQQQMHQQVPQQQMHQQVPQQQQQHHQPHGHAPHGQQILNAANIANEKEHIMEHMDVPIDTSKMSEQELQFHYFKMHDADNNNKLDGCELIKSLIHWHDEGDKDKGSLGPAQTDSEIEQMLDPILAEMDKNGDGYIEYSEFKMATEH